jgi:acetyltransferase-like isoleucine patch superfamily enzyme
MKRKLITILRKLPLINNILLIRRKVLSDGSPKSKVIGKNNVILFDSSKNHIIFDVKGNNNYIDISHNVSVTDTTIYVRGSDHYLKIEENCVIQNSHLYLEEHACSIIINKQTTFEGVHVAAVESNVRITIGEDCMFSHSIELRTGDSHSIIDNNTGKRINYPKDVIIGKHVWIGAYSKILKGVHIEDNSVIALGSIVTDNVKSNCIYGGVPAKLLKTNISWIRERIK